MPLYQEGLPEYLDGLVPERAPELAAMEAWGIEQQFPILGPASSQFCYLVARMLRARNVYELGSGFGYSTAWFARAVDENGGGAVHHVVWHEDLHSMAKQHLARLGYPDASEQPTAKTRIHYTLGEAVEAFTQQTGPFDVVFMDIDKTGYPAALPLIEKRLRPGGALLIDNLLWHGEVISPDMDDAQTAAIVQTTQYLVESPDWECSLIPLRDGVMLALKKE